MSFFVRDTGVWKDGELFVRNAGVWKPVANGYVRDGGVWKEFYAAAPAGITMTAGELVGISAIGYSDGINAPPGGGISGQPLAGEIMNALAYLPLANVSLLVFSGNVVSIISSMSLYVDDVPYSLAGASFDGSFTSVNFAGLPVFADGLTYNIRIE